jgi:putative phage-type endonuclease
MLEQRSDAWFAIRAGKVTASRIADLMAKTKSGPSASRKNYAAQLVAERLTGAAEQSYCSPAMQHGIDHEADARDRYCEHMLCVVDEVAFVEHPTIPMSGASPDGCIGDDGLCEIKCPQVATHIDTLLGQKVPEKYRLQMLWQMACTGRAYCDFVSYCPSLPEPMQLFVQRVPRDDEAIAELEREVTAFLAEVEQTVAALQARYGDLEQQLTQSLEAA